MEYYAGLDVSLEATSVCIVSEAGAIVCEMKVPSDPEAIGTALIGTRLRFKRIGLEPCASGSTAASAPGDSRRFVSMPGR